MGTNFLRGGFPIKSRKLNISKFSKFSDVFFQKYNFVTPGERYYLAGHTGEIITRIHFHLDELFDLKV